MIAIYRFSNKQDKLFKIQIRIQNCTELSLSSCILPLQFTLMAIWMKNYREMSISTSDSKFKIKSHNYLYLLSRPNSFLLSDQQVSSWPILWLGISTLGPIFRVARIFHTHITLCTWLYKIQKVFQDMFLPNPLLGTSILGWMG